MPLPICRAAAAAAAVIVTAGAGGAPSAPAIVLAAVATRDQAVGPYRAGITVTARSLTFPWGKVTVHGTLAYDAPATYTYTLSDVPFYARGLEHLNDEMTKPATWTHERLRDAGHVTVAGHVDDEIEVSPVPGSSDLRTIDALVDPERRVVDRAAYHFTDGDIVVGYAYTTFAGHPVIASQHADVRRGRTRAAIDLVAADYRRDGPAQTALDAPR